MTKTISVLLPFIFLFTGCYTYVGQREAIDRNPECAGLRGYQHDPQYDYKLHPNLLNALLLVDKSLQDSLPCTSINELLHQQDSIFFIWTKSSMYPEYTIQVNIVSTPDSAGVMGIIEKYGGKFEGSRLSGNARGTACFIWPSGISRLAALPSVMRLSSVPKQKKSMMYDSVNADTL